MLVDFLLFLDQTRYLLITFLALLSGSLFYAGISSKKERTLNRFRFNQVIQGQREKYNSTSKNSADEKHLRRAGYPLGIDGSRYKTIRIIVIGTFAINYIILPMLLGQYVSKWFPFLLFCLVILSEPMLKWSLFRYVTEKLYEQRQIKRNSELFQLHDLIITELEMMTNHRINTYNLLKEISPYFKVIEPHLSRLLVNWKYDHRKALNEFATSLNTDEARSLASVLKTLDDNEISVALESLKSNSELFLSKQIEMSRRKRDLYKDTMSMPVKLTIYIFMFNMFVVVAYMVFGYLDKASL